MTLRCPWNQSRALPLTLALLWQHCSLLPHFSSYLWLPFYLYWGDVQHTLIEQLLASAEGPEPPVEVELIHNLHVCGPLHTRVPGVSTADPLMEAGEGGCSSPAITSNSIILLSVRLCWGVSLFSLSCLCWLLRVGSSSPILPYLAHLPSFCTCISLCTSCLYLHPLPGLFPHSVLAFISGPFLEKLCLDVTDS